SSGECFGKEATNRLRVMLPKGRTIYLERDPSDPGGAGSLLRYVWFKGIKGGVYLANEIMVREGYAILDDNQAVLDEAATEGRGLDRLRTAQEAAAAKQVGWWTTCRGTAVAVAAALEAATLNTGAADTALGATEPDTPQDATSSDSGLGGTGSDAAGPVVPVRVAIPAIGVDAGIEQVGIVDGVMGTPQDPWAVGWYPDYGAPGGGGSVVMSGHKDWWSIGPTVFANLGALGGGEAIFVTGADGSLVTYQVTAAWAVDAGTPAEAVIGGAGGESLTLITCTGNFDGAEYDSRYIVQGVRI
ncbi:MAG: sortase, partial [Chloroflexota bacterium]|nr:sortase [Chloroflexota bacterium]